MDMAAEVENKNEAGKFRVRYVKPGDLLAVAMPPGHPPMAYKVVEDRVQGEVVGHSLEAVNLRDEIMGKA